ncbi:RelA/SpoT domain-containing protein [Pseudomonas synxantha]|uniref:RelA/SpoT domain-containing protein n=1 Tax=Pseudomonas synxantha TaxID=47883 RepID=UPI002367FDD4|nr:RelA/SpoT domain-containing protein [Pseudomonas synxantha]WDG42877.1 RelA/SpoT domain-containing protein [Pseudomonas synxantha]
MSFSMTLEDFLTEAGSNLEEWGRTTLNWDELLEIATHHEKSRDSLSVNAASIANRLQGFKGVHSVRWRVKDTLGMLKKILRKNLEESPKDKWIDINPSNYRAAFSDLIGIRGLHLLKEDSAEIDKQIRETWKIVDTSIFLREGDTYPTELLIHNPTISNHVAGYRSIHYGFEFTAEIEHVFIEIQTRTLFQEGWSEIDHKIKYPNISDNQLLDYCLNVFNGLSGTADDLASFVMELDKITKINNELLSRKESALIDRDLNIEKMQNEIDKLKEEGLASKNTIDSLQNSIDNIKIASTTIESPSVDKTETPPRKITLNRRNAVLNSPIQLGAAAELAKIYSSLNHATQLQNSSLDHAAKIVKQLTAPYPELDRVLKAFPELGYLDTIKKLTSKDEMIARTLSNFVSGNNIHSPQPDDLEHLKNDETTSETTPKNTDAAPLKGISSENEPPATRTLDSKQSNESNNDSDDSKNK